MTQMIEEYISRFPDEMQLKLNRLGKIINQTAPPVNERLAWGALTHCQRGSLMEFAAFKSHVGLYYMPSTLEYFKKELEPYKANMKDTIQVYMDQPLSEELIEKLVHFWLKGNGS